MSLLPLAGVWHLSEAGGEMSCDFALPGDGITALERAGLIPDPYYGRNEYDLRWICERTWIATRRFELTHTDVDLVLSEVDTIATITVNGVEVAHLDNAFRTWRIPLGKVAQIGENEIEIAFHSPVMAGKAKQDAHPFEIPWSKNCPIPYGNFIRKPACDFGWDWNIALAPFGIYGRMEIERADVVRIDRISVEQAHREGSVDVTVVAHVKGQATSAAVAFAGQEVTTFLIDGTATVALTIHEPELWWPAGQGGQKLYDLKVTCGGAEAVRRIGLRQIDLVTEQDEAGLGFKFRVNGRDIFCKGANWIPADALPGRITDEKTRDLLQSAVDANMNMIRVWGGGRYEPDSFYDACDELGLLIWQDFMFACNLYPSDRAFLENVRAEVRDNVGRLQHHACLALWCGDNELIGALTWYDVSRADRDRYLVNYDRLNRAVEDALQEVDPKAIWWPSSPSPGPMSFGDAWHDDGSGDMHFWSVWHEGRDFEHYRDVSPRFCSEFGFQSYPSLNAIRDFAEPNDWNIAAPVFESHQKNAGGNARIAETMFRYFRWPERFEDFVYLSQVQHALAMKTAVSHWRCLAPHCMGALFWQLNDTWPVCSWASLDYGGDWKLLQHAAQRFFAPTLVTIIPEGEALTIKGVSDDPAQPMVTVTVSRLGLDGAVQKIGGFSEKLTSDAKVLGQIAKEQAGDDLLLLDWNGGREVFALKPYKTYELSPSDVQLNAQQVGEAHRVTLSANGLSLFTALEANVPGRWNANLFNLLPGEVVEATFTPRYPNSQPQFTCRDLYSATTQRRT